MQSTSSAEDMAPRGSVVNLHIYDVDRVSAALLNSAGGWPRHAGLGVFHCGVEVLGLEYSFQYYWDAWEMDGLTGVQRHRPKSNPLFRYIETIELGTTPMSRSEVLSVIGDLTQAWPSSSYHLISRNCVDFAEDLVSRLKVPGKVPRWVAGLGRSVRASSLLRRVVGCFWSMVVWAMILTTREISSAREISQLQVGASDVESKLALVVSRVVQVALPFTSAALVFLVSLPWCPLPLSVPLASGRCLPLGMALGCAASAAALLHHWGIVGPIRWLEHGAGAAFAVWTAVRGLAVHRSAAPLTPAALATLFLALSSAGRGADRSRKRGLGSALLLTVAPLLSQVCMGLAGLQLVYVERAGMVAP